MNSQTLLEQVALQWHHERYVLLRRAQPGRCDQVLAWLTNHIVPFMTAYAADHPGYAFDVHKGYCTRAHQAELDELGPCPIHRMKWDNVARTVRVGQS